MLSGIRSSRAAEEEGFGLEIWKCGGVRHVEFPSIADTVPNVGTMPERIEEEDGMNEPRELWGVYISGGGGRWPPA
jgi:hypothetical protein